MTRRSELYSELGGPGQVDRWLEGRSLVINRRDSIDHIMENCSNVYRVADLVDDIKGALGLEVEVQKVIPPSLRYDRRRLCEKYHSMVTLSVTEATEGGDNSIIDFGSFLKKGFDGIWIAERAPCSPNAMALGSGRVSARAGDESSRPSHGVRSHSWRGVAVSSLAWWCIRGFRARKLRNLELPPRRLRNAQTPPTQDRCSDEIGHPHTTESLCVPEDGRRALPNSPAHKPIAYEAISPLTVFILRAETAIFS